MKNLKQFICVLLTAVMLLSVGAPVFAAADEAGFSDVAADAWYADAVAYVQAAGLMSGTSATTFSPEADTNRAMLVSILHRMANNPAPSGNAAFTDVAKEAYYHDAVLWAVESGILSSRTSDVFGSEETITREEIAAVLWRYVGTPAVEPGMDFVDESDISSDGATAVDWARAFGIMNGHADGRFDPQGHTTRAQLAAILQNFMIKKTAEAPVDPASDARTLVVYFSATGSTEAVAEYIADSLHADLYAITPQTPYTAADLNWNEAGSRVNDEHNAPDFRPAIAGDMPNLANYDQVFLGYPIWWGEAPNIVRTFMEQADLTGKTVIPFCTSTSSGLGSSAETLQAFAPNATWLEGQRFASNVSREVVEAWVQSLPLSVAATPTPVTPTPAATTPTASTLVVYFSMPETSNATGMTTEEDNSVVVIDGEVLGNTQYMAQVIGEATDADIFRIEPETPYPTNHTILVDLAADEQAANVRPALKNHVDNMDQYDTIFIGYPIWWSDMPMILYSFFDEYDLSGKTLIPFSTHGGSSFAGTPATIRQLEPNAVMLEGLTISRDRIQDAQQEISDWVSGLALQ